MPKEEEPVAAPMRESFQSLRADMYAQSALMLDLTSFVADSRSIEGSWGRRRGRRRTWFRYRSAQRDNRAGNEGVIMRLDLLELARSGRASSTSVSDEDDHLAVPELLQSI